MHYISLHLEGQKKFCALTRSLWHTACFEQFCRKRKKPATQVIQVAKKWAKKPEYPPILFVLNLVVFYLPT